MERTTAEPWARLCRVVLVVEDDPGDLRDITGILVASGHRLLTATTGSQALSVISAERPAVVILDLTLPDIDGFQVFERIRKTPDTASTVVILTHPAPTDEMVFRAFRLHSDCFMRKPVCPRELETWVERSLPPAP